MDEQKKMSRELEKLQRQVQMDGWKQHFPPPQEPPNTFPPPQQPPNPRPPYSPPAPPSPTTQTPRQLVNTKFAIALMVAVGLCLAALIPMLFHPNATYDTYSTVQCYSGMDRLTGNVSYGVFTSQAAVDASYACAHRVDAMDGIASALLVPGVVLGIIAFCYRRQALRHLAVWEYMTGKES